MDFQPKHVELRSNIRAGTFTSWNLRGCSLARFFPAPILADTEAVAIDRRPEIETSDRGGESYESGAKSTEPT